MAMVVVLWSLTPSIDKLRIARSSVGLHGLIQVCLISLALAGWMLLRQGGRAFSFPRDAQRPLAATGVLAGIGYGLQLAAYHLTLVASVELLKRMVGMAAALILGRTALREPLTPAKIAGVCIIAVGLPLVLS